MLCAEFTSHAYVTMHTLFASTLTPPLPTCHCLYNQSNNPTERFKGDDAEATPGLGSAPNLSHLHKQQQQQQQSGGDPTQARGPHVPSQDIAASLEAPKSREELQAASAKLNE